jgi:hypothetical protein
MIATQDIAINTPIVKFDGPKMRYCDIPEEEKCYALWIQNDEYMIPKTDARFINHSCDPNCNVNNDYDVIPIHPIKAGEEISFSYDIVHENEDPGEWDPKWTFKCECGAKNCRGFINKYVNEDGSNFSCN